MIGSTRAAGLAALLALPFAAAVHGQEPGVPNTFAAGEPAVADDVNENFDALATRIDSVVERVTDLEPEPRQLPPLAIELTGSGAVLPARGLEGGAAVRLRGASPTADPLHVEGLPGALSELIEDLALGRRINGRALRIVDGTAEPLLTFDNAYVVEMHIPAVGPASNAPFEVALGVDPETADVGPFASEPLAMPDRPEDFEPDVELSVGSLGVTVQTLAAEPITVLQPRAARLSLGEPPVLHLPSNEAGPVLEAFSSSYRVDDVRIRYLRPDGSVAFAITAVHARFQRVTPDYAGGAGVRVEVALEEPGLAEY